jgi:uncharacterized protein
MTLEQPEMNKQQPITAQGIHVVAKPTGPACNLNCEYCFYLEKQVLFSSRSQYLMSDAVLAAFINNYVTSQPTPVVEFVWQGGEPTLAGLEFFKRVIELQRPLTRQKTIRNAIQTNGTLLDDTWCRFLKRHDFMVGISLDGPKEIHDRYRRNRKGRGTFERTMNGLRFLQKHQVEYNVMACVARETAAKPLEVYGFFRDAGVEHIQFTPIVERMPDATTAGLGLRLAAFPSLDRQEQQTEVADWSVLPKAYGDFLIAVYEEWVRHDVGKIFVMNFEWALNAWIGNPSPVCTHARQCGRSLVIEHNGDVFACDHSVYPQSRIGNILTDTLPNMVEKSLKTGFGIRKETALPRWCRECDVLAACQGGCPKHRFATTYYNEPGLHYLCAGYQNFFRHIRKYLSVMVQLLENGLPASLVMNAIQGPLVVNLGKNTGKPGDKQKKG